MVRYSSSSIPILDLVDLPRKAFKVSLSKKTINLILNKLPIRSFVLYKEFSKLESQKSKKIDSIKSSFLNSWKKGERIPIDCFELLCELTGQNSEKMQRGVITLFSGSSKKGWPVSFPCRLNLDFFFVSEAIRTEGCIMKGKRDIQGLAISNKDLQLMNLFADKLKKLKISEDSFSKLLHVYCYLDTEDEVQSVSCRSSKKELHFNLSKGRLIFLDSLSDFNDCQRTYEIVMNHKKYLLKTRIDKENTICTESQIHSTTHFSLQAYNSVFAKFLHYCFDIPYGIGTKKSYIIDFPFDIAKLSDSIIKEILNIVISCEGHINIGSKSRAIRIKLASIAYLRQLREMLDIIGISSSKIYPSKSDRLYYLEIRRRNNFIRFSNTIRLYHLSKKNKLTNLINSFQKKRLTHGEAKNTYLRILQENEPANLREISKVMNQKYVTVIAAFSRLYNEGFVEKKGRAYTGRGSTPWTFELSKKGRRHLSKNGLTGILGA